MGRAGGVASSEGMGEGEEESACMDGVQPHMLKFRDCLGMSHMRLIQLAYARGGK